MSASIDPRAGLKVLMFPWSSGSRGCWRYTRLRRITAFR
jgi:hypothetical protein